MVDNNYSIEDFDRDVRSYVSSKSISIREFNIVLEVVGKPYEVYTIIYNDYSNRYYLIIDSCGETRISINRLYNNYNIYKINVDLKTLAKYIKILIGKRKSPLIYKSSNKHSFQYQIYSELKDNLITLLSLHIFSRRSTITVRFRPKCTRNGYMTRQKLLINNSWEEEGFVLGCQINLLDNSIRLCTDLGNNPEHNNQLYCIDLDKVKSIESCKILTTILFAIDVGDTISFSVKDQCYVIAGEF